MGRPWSVVLVVVCAFVAGQIARLGALAPVLLAGVLVVMNVLTLRWRLWRLRARFLDPRWFVGPVALSWLVVTLLPVHKFSHRGVTAAGPSLNVESLIELLAFAGAGVVALIVLRTLEPTLSRCRPPLLLFLLPVWTAITGMWSTTGLYAIARGAQLVAVAMLAWATIALARADASLLEAVVDRVLRWFVRLTVALVGLGVLFGPLYVSAKEANLDRFTWLGAHPLASGLILSVATVVLLSTPLATLRMSRGLRTLVAAAFVVALFANHSRQSWLGLVIVLIVALGLIGRLTPLVRWIGAPAVGAAAVAGVMFRGPQVWDYVLRNEDSDSLSSGNGRMRLWSIGFRALETPFDWMFGLGHGITRTVFVPEEPWAITAHSSFLNVLLSAGLIGMCLFVVLLLGIGRSVVLGRLWRRSATGFVLVLLLVLVLVNGIVSDNLAEPNLGFAILYLVAAGGIAARTPSVPVSEDPDRERLHPASAQDQSWSAGFRR